METQVYSTSRAAAPSTTSFFSDMVSLKIFTSITQTANPMHRLSTKAFHGMILEVEAMTLTISTIKAAFTRSTTISCRFIVHLPITRFLMRFRLL